MATETEPGNRYQQGVEWAPQDARPSESPALGSVGHQRNWQQQGAAMLQTSAPTPTISWAALQLRANV